MSTESAVKHKTSLFHEFQPKPQREDICLICGGLRITTSHGYDMAAEAEKVKRDSAVKHTPGPWAVHGTWPDDVVDASGALVVSAYGDYESPVTQANACLIAAAPAMLAELQDAHHEFVGLAAYLATCAPGTIIENLETIVGNLHKKADEFELVIKKAKGE